MLLQFNLLTQLFYYATLVNLLSSVQMITPQQGQSREHISEELSQATIKAKNLFIEASQLSLCDDINMRSQFYKTNSSIQRLHNCIRLNKSPKRIMVTGGAGFVGSHLVDSLMLDGHQILVLDNFYTGRKANIEHWLSNKNFKLIEQDVIEKVFGTDKLDQIYHLAAPASPVHYMADPIKTINTIILGTMNILEMAKGFGARVVLASTSEIYGDPLIHPQEEDYWGNTNPVGPRACYDESKRLAETLAVTNGLEYNTSVGIARIFNTYGPRMNQNDGRVISNFITQAIENKPMTVYGSGNQTRSFQYINDLVAGLKALMQSNVSSPVNLGNPEEMTILNLAQKVQRAVPRSSSKLIHKELPIDDPTRRRPSIIKALDLLHWSPQVSLTAGLKRTIEYFVQDLKDRD